MNIYELFSQNSLSRVQTVSVPLLDVNDEDTIFADVVFWTANPTFYIVYSGTKSAITYNCNNLEFEHPSITELDSLKKILMNKTINAMF